MRFRIFEIDGYYTRGSLKVLPFLCIQKNPCSNGMLVIELGFLFWFLRVQFPLKMDKWR